MGFWFFGPFTWRWGGGDDNGKKRGITNKPRSARGGGGRFTVFGAFVTLPLLGWQLATAQHSSAPTPPPLPAEFDHVEDAAKRPTRQPRP